MKQTSAELLEFVEKALSQRIPREQITSVLKQAGWQDDQIHNAMDNFVETDFPIPVPKPKVSHTARETFLYLLMITSLFIFAINLGSALYYLIDKAFPNPSIDPSVERSLEQVRWAISLMVVSLPVFIVVTNSINRALRKVPEKRRSIIRKWLTYLTLFIAASVIIGDTAALIYNLLSGDLTLRFVLKVLTIGVISGSVFLLFVSSSQR